MFSLISWESFQFLLELGYYFAFFLHLNLLVLYLKIWQKLMLIRIIDGWLQIYQAMH